MNTFMPSAYEFSDLSNTSSHEPQKTASVRSQLRSTTLPATRPRDLLAAGLEALDFLNLGVLVTDESRLILVANRTAEHILSDHDGLDVTPDGSLCETRGACSPPLSSVIQQVKDENRSSTSSSTGAVLAVRRRSGRRP